MPRTGFLDVAHGAARHFVSVHDASQIARHQHDIGGFNRHIGACADRDTDIGMGEGRGIVDAISNEGDTALVTLEFSQGVNLAVGQTPAMTMSIPVSAAIASAVSRLSPVIIATFKPSS